MQFQRTDLKVMEGSTTGVRQHRLQVRWYLLLFLLIFGLQSAWVLLRPRNSPPYCGDAAEVHNIAYSLVHGHGYSFDRNDAEWRKLWDEQNLNGKLDFVVVRRGAHPTMFRPPLMPILVAGILRLSPSYSFLVWRIVDSAAFALAACLLCDIAFLEGGTVALVAILLVLLGDPLRRQFIPGWWTEGLAFALLSFIVWLIASRARVATTRYNVYAGLAVGLLCLDRSMFVLALPLICVTLGMARLRSTSAVIKSALIILGISILIQVPWWARNIAVSGRFLPLGTQGGFNLPDEYGDAALQNGQWTGQGIRDVWIPPSEANLPIPIPPGFTKESFARLWGDSQDNRYAATLYATVCNSLRSEIAVSDSGQRAAVAWIRANPAKVPKLMIHKLAALTFSKRSYLTVLLSLYSIAFCALPKLTRQLLCLAMLAASYLLVVALTHVVYTRFLLPILPAMYVGAALGVSSVLGWVSKRVVPRFERLLVKLVQID